MPSRSITEVLGAHTPGLMAIPDVVGTAEGQREDGTACIVVMVRLRSAELEAQVPKRIEGHPVEIRAMGDFEARPPQDR